MARFTVLVMAVVAFGLPMAQAAFGSSYQLIMPTPYKTYMKKLAVSIKVPALPQNPTDYLVLWPGIYTGDNKVLYQPALFSVTNPASFCGGKAGQWCMAATYIVNNTQENYGPLVPVNVGDTLNMVVESNGVGKGYKQSVTRGSTVLSSISGGAGLGECHVFFTEVECQQGAKGISPAHTYTGITITLGAKDADFGSTVTIGTNAVTASKLYTNDGGLNWKIDSIVMQASQCTPETSARAQVQGSGSQPWVGSIPS